MVRVRWRVQIAKSLVAEMTGVDGTKKLDMMRSIGADHVIDYTQEDFTRTGQRYGRRIWLVPPRRPPRRWPSV